MENMDKSDRGLNGTYTAGVDIGAAFAKAVIMSGRDIKSWAVLPSKGDYRTVATDIMDKVIAGSGVKAGDLKYVIATGSGAGSVSTATATENDISCTGRGTHFLFPSVRTIIDIGSQFTRVFRIDEKGRLVTFVMSEKCAGGSGRLFQVMSRILQVDISELGKLSENVKNKINFTTGCAVFNESEVISRIAEGNLKEDIIDGLQDSLAAKVEGLVERVKMEPDYSVAGGCGKNAGLIHKLAGRFGMKPLVHTEPQIVTALGAALIAGEKYAAGSI